MYEIISDRHMHFEFARILQFSWYGGADLFEVLNLAPKIKPNSYEDWYNNFSALAERVSKQAKAIDAAKFPVSARDALFKESNYWRAADFFLHGDKSDKRIVEIWDKMIAAFDKAIALLPNPGKRITLKGKLPGSEKPFDIPAIYFSSELPGPQRTVIIGTGFDGSQEEMYHANGRAALERGYNVIVYEGPGQPAVVRYQGLGFITEWERVITPIVDYLVTLPEVDPKKIAILGLSLGGYLAPRAAAFEPRLAAVLALGGVSDFGSCIESMLPEVQHLVDSGDKAGVDAHLFKLVADLGKSNPKGRSLRWAVEHGLWAYDVDSPYEFLLKAKEMTLKDVAHQIKVPMFVADYEHDLFFAREAKELAAWAPDVSTFYRFAEEDGAGHHCGMGAAVLHNQVVFDWLDEVLEKSA